MTTQAGYLFPSAYGTIDFSTNWNNKLNCNFFTTVRLWRNQFRVGDKWIVRLNEKEIKLVQVLTVKQVRLHELDSTITLLDAGLMPEKFRELMLEIYGDKVPSVDDALFVLVALSTIETYAVAPAQ